MSNHENELHALDDAARAGWLYYVGGKTQDEIAKTLGVSRQRAQRLVSRAVSEKLVRVRLEHPISDLMELSSALKAKYGLKRMRVAPDIGLDGNLASVAPFAALVLESILAAKESKTIAFGTGRALRATIEAMPRMTCEHHKLVSLIGNIAPDGTASFYDVIMRIADIVRAPHYPLPTPVIAETEEERDTYMSLKPVKQVLDFASKADAIFVGIGQFDESAPMRVDGFISDHEWNDLRNQNAVGEIVGNIFDHDGNYVESSLSNRITSSRFLATEHNLCIGIASGTRKIPAIRAALKGKLINGLVTDEPTARALLAD